MCTVDGEDALGAFFSEAARQGATLLLTYAPRRSRHAARTAAEAAARGLKCVVLTDGPARAGDGGTGAEICYLDDGTFRDAPREEYRALYRRLTAASVRSLAAEYEERGERVCIVPWPEAQPEGPGEEPEARPCVGRVISYDTEGADL